MAVGDGNWQIIEPQLQATERKMTILKAPPTVARVERVALLFFQPPRVLVALLANK